ncbi:MAG TPA: carboxypeptidase-like regulatory domain-containing protein, partial [Thermoanaerobaculia bacterium]
RPATRTIDVRGGAFDFGAIGLTRMPRIEGEVRGEDGKPLAGARVALHPAGGTATTGPSGRFAIDVEGHWPTDVLVTRDGFGTRVVRLDATEGNVTLPPVTLRRGATLQMRIVRGAERGPIEVKIGLATRDDGRPVWLATKKLEPGRTSIAFTDLERDVYRILLSGPEPLQRMLLSAVVQEQQKTVEVSLPGVRTRAAVTLGGDPLPGATVEMHRQGLWRSSVVTDEKGEFGTAVWESTDLDALVTGGGLPAPRVVRLPAGGGLNIDLPARTLRGTVADGSGKPVPHALLALEVVQNDVRAFIRTKSDAEGRYAFAALPAGEFSLHLEAPGYLRIDPIAVAIAEDQNVAEQAIVLATSYPRALEIVDGDGRPAAGAAVVCAFEGRIRAKKVADAEGRVTIDTPAERSTLFIIPREGSLAVVRLQPALDDATLVHRIVIPPGEARLDITALATGDVPIPGVSLLMRFNGELFTPEIARELRMRHRSTLRTGDDGRATLTQIPSGYYEFWPYQSDEEAQMLIDSSAATAAPIALHVTKGDNQVKVRFDARE